MKRPFKLIAVLCALTLGLGTVAAPSTPALAEESSADLQAQLDQAKTKRDEYFAQAEEVSEQLNITRDQISELDGKIADTQKNIDAVQKDIEAKEAELAKRQEQLAESIAVNYKAGTSSMLSLVLDATSFDDFVTRVYYADKVSDQQASNIEETNRLKGELDAQRQKLDAEKASLQDQKAQQEQLLAQQEVQQAELDAKVREADAYVASLGQQVQDALAREAEEARRQAEEAAAAAAAAAEAASGNYYTPAASQGGSQGTVSTGSGSGSLTSAQRNTILSAAYSLVGRVNYVWGGEDPGTGLDCSGFTKWCYAQAGIGLPHSSGSQRSLVASASGLKSPANAIPGDLVCWNGHVGIYAGGNTVIDCTPGIGTRVASIWSPCLGAGSPV